MQKVTKCKLGKREITVTEHFPDDPDDMNKIRNILAEFYLTMLRKKYSDAELEIMLPIWQKMEQLQSEGYNYEEIKVIIKKLYK